MNWSDEQTLRIYQSTFKEGDIVSFKNSYGGTRYAKFLGLNIEQEKVDKVSTDLVGDPPSLVKNVTKITARLLANNGSEFEKKAGEIERIFRP